MIIQPPCPWGNSLLSKSRHVPDTNGLIERGRSNKVLTGVELSTHHIVVVPSQDTGGERQRKNEARGGGGGGERKEETEREGAALTKHKFLTANSRFLLFDHLNNL